MLIWVAVFGGLRIHLAALKTAEHFLESSGWTGALVQTDVPIPGKADSYHQNKTSQSGDSFHLAPIVGRGTPRTCEVNRVQH